MTRRVRVAALQLRATDRSDFVRSLDVTIEAVRDSAARADLVVLPEGTFPAYVLGAMPLDGAPIDAALESLSKIARSAHCVIVAGATSPGASGPRNSAFVFDADGSLAGRADKLFLWHFDRRWYVRGERLEPVRTSIGTLGVLICADGRLPTIARALVDRGAEMLVMPTAWVTSGRDPHALENVQADLLARVRAYENRVPFVAANKCGTELGMVAYCGKSQIVNAAGEVMALAGEDHPETLEAVVALAEARPIRPVLAALGRRAALRESPLRLAISFDPLPHDIDERLQLLDDEYALALDDHRRLARLDAALPVAAVGDAVVLDPGGLVEYRRAGYLLICWTTDLSDEWPERIARARALELRLYLTVFHRCAARAFAVDPDGAVVAGTFSDYRLASFSLDPRKTRQTCVAPGSDILEGLAFVSAVGEHPERTTP